jgi:predicted small lipoprotein YifL
MKQRIFQISFVAGIFVAVLTACGVKGPPLPPVSANPSDSELPSRSGTVSGYVETPATPAIVIPEPSPTPSPSPTPHLKKKKKKR